MQSTLHDFIRVLRSAGVRISTAEVIDGHHAVRTVGVQDRILLRDALGTTLAKTTEERDIFEGCFERFFRFHELEPAADEATDESAEPSSQDADPEHGGDGPAPAQPSEADMDEHAESALSRQLLQGDWTRIDAAIAAAGQREGLNRMASFTQRGRFARAITDAIGVRDMDAEIARLEAGNEVEQATALALERGRQVLRERVRDHVERHVALFANPEEARLRQERLPYIRLNNLEQRHYADMRRLVERMARKLASVHSRRQRQTRRGQLDIRRTLRSGLAYDGVPFNPRWRQKRRDRPRVIALCDISGSVEATARFLLMFLYSVSDVMPGTRAFVFCSDAHEVTDLFKAHPLENAVATAVQRYGNQPSHYGEALAQFTQACLSEIDGRTTVLVLGDARSNYGDPGLRHLREVYTRARRVIWLNPEPPPLWGYGDSEMPRLSSACHEVRPCNTLKQLEQVVETLLRAGG